MELLSERIAYARRKISLSQADLAKKVGVSQSTVGMWESGTRKDLTALNAVSVADALKVSIRWLITGAGDIAHEDQVPFLYADLQAYLDEVRRIMSSRQYDPKWVEELINDEANYLGLAFEKKTSPGEAAFEIDISPEESAREPVQAGQPDGRLKVELSSSAKKHLGTLVATGLWGATVEEAGKRLIEQSLASKLETGFLRQSS